MENRRDIGPNEPLIAGVAQKMWRDGCPGPVEMLAKVLSAAADDSGVGRPLLDRLDAICAIKYISATHPDPGALISTRLGIEPDLRIATANGGDTPHVAISQLAARIAAGELDAAAVVGGEAMKTWALHDRDGTSTGWDDEVPDSSPDEILGVDRWGNSQEEMDIGLLAPISVYPLFEHALWAKHGDSRADLAIRLGQLQERFSLVAAHNPHAWGPTGLTAEEIASPSAANRKVSLPYTKAMNANIQTDQAAAVIILSSGLADELAISPDRRVYLHGSAHGVEPWNISERADLSRSPMLGATVSAALRQAAADVQGISHLDIYSCFPSAVEIAGKEIGYDPLTDPREPTVTGGLAFAGGPGNAYVLQALTALVGRLRANPGDLGMITAVGWYLTKHGAGIYGTSPPAEPFTAMSELPEQSAERRVASGGGHGVATAEVATVIYDREGEASIGFLTALLDDGRRILRSTTDAALLGWIDSGQPVTGRLVDVSSPDRFAPID